MATAAVVEDFFCSLGDSCDDEVVTYIVSMLEDDDLDSSTVSDVEELLCGLSQSFADCEPKDRLAKIQHLIERVQSLRKHPIDKSRTLPVTQLATNPTLLPLAVTDTSNIITAPTSKPPTAAANAHQLTPSVPAHAAAPAVALDEPAVEDRQLSELYSLCGGCVGMAYLQHLLHASCSGDLQAAAAAVLDCEDLPAAEAAWRATQQNEEQQRREEERQQQRIKQQILARFDLQPLKEVQNKSKRGSGDTAVAAAAPGSVGGKRCPSATAGIAAPQVRYREGQVVSRTGDRYIVEQVKEDWDGGSKGKVYTKGKRGKGFV